jgi:hypothetical protein
VLCWRYDFQHNDTHPNTSQQIKFEYGEEQFILLC